MPTTTPTAAFDTLEGLYGSLDPVALLFELLGDLVNVHGGILAPTGPRLVQLTSFEGHRHCGKKFKRKPEQGPVDHKLVVRCKVYENGRVAADSEMLRLLKQFSEREIEEATGLHRSRVRLLRHGGTVTRRTYQRIRASLVAHTAAK